MVGKGITPLRRHRQREQFARAVDAHPGSAPAEGDEFADELAVVALLREAAVTSGPDEAARARMRARVLGAAEPPPTKVDQVVRERRAGARGRLAVALAAALCLVFSLAGMSLLLSRDALPGDALYGVKRTAESASLGLTFDEESKGYKRLEFAAARVAEIETLVDRYRESGGGPLGGYLTALTDFDADAAAGSRVLTALGSNSDRRALEGLRDWAAAQATRLTELRPSLPAEAADRAGTSLDLLTRIADRASALHARADCVSVTSGQLDQVGPVPAQDECAARPVEPGSSPSTLPPVPGTTTADPPTTTGEAPGGTRAPSGEPGPATTPSNPVIPPTTTPAGPLLPLPTLTLPSLPLPSLGG
ncbi:DUF5667 domain-containing protein [Saccharothrix sp. S26]|uniref:DUF5667 domain-containing protein n=1 Tax=Saccharothrix sp. S26 TaxID=2907215 RepID=UPI001F28B85B|nr:DUF5667 domain-containing protein [Saccharothrix sp. S26]MCE6995859.1 DUF5667 domain-containing protein [Saccharothrix sp. S26]